MTPEFVFIDAFDIDGKRNGCLMFSQYSNTPVYIPGDTPIAEVKRIQENVKRKARL